MEPAPQPTPEDKFASAIDLIKIRTRIVIVQGAGVSVASGIPDYRSTGGFFDFLRNKGYGLTPEEALSIDLFRKRPEVFHSLEAEFFLGKKYEPNEGHKLAQRIYDLRHLWYVFTQNVDGLQTLVVPPQLVLEFHGDKRSAKCIGKKCREPYDFSKYTQEVLEGKIPRCPRVSKTKGVVCDRLVKSNVVLYGERVDRNMNMRALHAVNYEADLMIVMGTSLLVYPFADLVARYDGDIILINREVPPRFLCRAALNLTSKTIILLGDIEEICTKLNTALRTEFSTALRTPKMEYSFGD